MPTNMPCIEPYVATAPVNITFGSADSNLIPFRTQAVVCGTHEVVDEPDLLTNRMSTYPYDIAGEGSGYALCLNRGIPGPVGQPYDLIAEETIHENYYVRLATRFILGNIPESPNYDSADPQFQRIRNIILAGFQMVASGELNITLYQDDGTPFVAPGPLPSQEAFLGPYSGWDAYGLAQVALWTMLNQMGGNCIEFVDGNGNDPGTAERARLYNAYVMLRGVALAWAVEDVNCETLQGCDAHDLSITAEGGTSYSFDSTGVPPDCAISQVTVGPFEITNCCNSFPNPTLVAPGANAAFVGADGSSVVTPGCGGPFYVRLTPPARDYTFQINANVNIDSARVYYFRYRNSPPYPANTLRQNMGLVRRTTEPVSTSLSISVHFTCGDEPGPGPEPEPEPEFPCNPVFPPPLIPPPPRHMAVHNNNNNNNNNNSSNNNASLQAMSSAMLCQLQQNWQALLRSQSPPGFCPGPGPGVPGWGCPPGCCPCPPQWNCPPGWPR